jgi:pimeloyl-ACP methyl ester carboxylesterase
LAEAGYHVVAPDQRGYGQTDRPAKWERYTQLHLVGDVIGLLDALDAAQAVVVGHDWGAPVAWHTALLRPDRVRGVAGLSIPYTPRGQVSGLTVLRSALGDGFYMQYFQALGVADAELARDARTSLRKFLYSASGDRPLPAGDPPPMVVPAGQGILDILLDPETLPAWLTEADLDYYTAEFERTGFTGGLNWYRTLDLSWELLAAWQDALILPPALYIAGDRDGARRGFQRLPAVAPNLRNSILLPGCGHWTQQERPTEVNAALIEFLQGL